MKKALMVTFLLVGALAFIAPADAWAG